jgi:hypothetical protein
VEVELHPEVQDELRELGRRSVPEYVAMLAAIEKLEVVGSRLPYPHTSSIKGSRIGLRELRPRAGRSAWRAFYRRVGDELVVGAIGPEAKQDPRGFEAAVAKATERLAAAAGSVA